MASEQPPSHWLNSSTGAANGTTANNTMGGPTGLGGAAAAPATGSGGPSYDLRLSRLLEQNLREEAALRASGSSNGGGLDPSWLDSTLANASMFNNSAGGGGGGGGGGPSNFDATSFLSSLQNDRGGGAHQNASQSSASEAYQSLLLQSQRASQMNNGGAGGGAGTQNNNSAEDTLAALQARMGGGGSGAGATTSSSNRQLEQDVLEDFRKILQNNAEQQQQHSIQLSGGAGNGAGGAANSNSNTNANHGHLQGGPTSNDISQLRFGGTGGNDTNFNFPFNAQQQFQQQLNRSSLDNFDLASLANHRNNNGHQVNNGNNSNQPSDAALWLALQQRQQQQQQLQLQQQLNQLNSNNGFSDQLSAMLPNHRFGGGGGGPGSSAAYSMLGNAMGGNFNNAAALSASFGGGPNGSDAQAQQQSSLLAALLAEPMTQLDGSHGSCGSGNMSSSFNTTTAGLGANGLTLQQEQLQQQLQAAAAASRKPPPASSVAEMNPVQAVAAAAAQGQAQLGAAAAAAPLRPTLPFRALSAYNFFFRDERDRIINGGEHDFTSVKKQKLLSEHWFRDRSVKRRHRKTHGKIAFTTLSKVISQGWRDLPEDKKAFYREVAAEDLDRYQRELDQYKLIDAANLTTSSTAALFGGSGVAPSVPDAFDHLDESQLTAAQKLNRAMAA